MALATPLMVIMVVAIMQFGILMHANTTLNESVRVGSRTLALMRGNSDPCSTAATKLKSAATGLTSSSISIIITVNGTAYGPSNSPTCSGAGATMSSGADAVMRATYPCSAFVYATDYIPSCTLTAQTTVRVE